MVSSGESLLSRPFNADSILGIPPAVVEDPSLSSSWKDCVAGNSMSWTSSATGSGPDVTSVIGSVVGRDVVQAAISSETTGGLNVFPVTYP